MTKIFVAGHNGMVGSAICRQLANFDVEVVTAGRDQLDLTRQSQVERFFELSDFDQVYLSAAKVGGIKANDTYRADFIYENLMIQSNIINAAFNSGIKRLLFLGSSCIYPREANVPLVESSLLTGPLERTNEPYAIAKIAGIKLCESYNSQYGTNYLSIMPTNLYGPNDSYSLNNSHVIPALIRKVFLADCLYKGDIKSIISDFKQRPETGVSNMKTREDVVSTLKELGIYKDHLSLWGSGLAMREFLWVDDLAEACIFCMSDDVQNKIRNEPNMRQNYHVNVGSGREISIKDLATLIAGIAGYRGGLLFDKTMPDGTLRKLMSSELINRLGWRPRVTLEDGIKDVYSAYIRNSNK